MLSSSFPILKKTLNFFENIQIQLEICKFQEKLKKYNHVNTGISLLKFNRIQLVVWGM